MTLRRLSTLLYYYYQGIVTFRNIYDSLHVHSVGIPVDKEKLRKLIDRHCLAFTNIPTTEENITENTEKRWVVTTLAASDVLHLFTITP